MKYWLYQTNSFYHRTELVQAQLVTPPTHTASQYDCGFGFSSPLQDEPYGVELNLTFKINPRHPAPDNYPTDRTFELYSKRLLQLLEEFDVKFEAFPATLIDKHNNIQDEFDYAVFHSLEGTIDAIDREQSGWQGDSNIGVPRLVLDDTKFEHRPLFLCDLIYETLMRDDLKQAIQQRGITGFGFLSLEQYCSIHFGLTPPYEP